MRIPEVQAELVTFANELREMARRVNRLERELTRRSPVTKAKPNSKRMTERMKEQVRLYAAHGFAQHEIAAKLRVNPGRVSETLRGKRT